MGLLQGYLLMIKVRIPDLQVKDTDTPQFDLRRLLFPGGAAINAKRIGKFYESCDWAAVDADRLAFITECHIAINSFDSVATRFGMATRLKAFIVWCDKNKKRLLIDKDELKKLYLEYDDFYFQRVTRGEVKLSSAKADITTLSILIDRVLWYPVVIYGSGLTTYSRCVKAYKTGAKKAVSCVAEKQSFDDTKALGHYCVDLSKALNTDNILSSLPFFFVSKVTGKQYRFPINMKPLNELHKISQAAVISSPERFKLRSPADGISGDKYRTALARLRIEAEVIIFIFQTGMNLSQVFNLRRERFKYELSGETDWVVTEYKPRANHTVNFRIFKSYKEWFKNYLAFCEENFSDDPYLFPAIPLSKRKTASSAFKTLRQYIKAHGVPWVSPSVIRKTRVNFILRESGDPERTAEMHQHGVMTMKKSYMLPSQQRSARALTIFWNENAPVSRIKGGCDRIPEVNDDKPDKAVGPDCIQPSGCLWCQKHQDIESLDYVWSLTSFKHLKTIEAARLKTEEIPPDLTIKRLEDKLEAFKSIHFDWVEEAQNKVEEGSYHPTWKNIIDFMEAR